jgi:hypothetical protein
MMGKRKHENEVLKTLKAEEKQLLKTLSELSTTGKEMNAGEVFKSVKDSVGIGFLDVAAEDQRDHVIEDPQMWVRAGRGPLLAEQPTDEREHHQGRRQGQYEDTGTGGHIDA